MSKIDYVDNIYCIAINKASLFLLDSLQELFVQNSDIMCFIDWNGNCSFMDSKFSYHESRNIYPVDRTDYNLSECVKNMEFPCYMIDFFNLYNNYADILRTSGLLSFGVSITSDNIVDISKELQFELNDKLYIAGFIEKV